jgi:hypothetical protein
MQTGREFPRNRADYRGTSGRSFLTIGTLALIRLARSSKFTVLTKESEL